MTTAVNSVHCSIWCLFCHEIFSPGAEKKDNVKEVKGTIQNVFRKFRKYEGEGSGWLQCLFNYIDEMPYSFLDACDIIVLNQ